MLKEEPHAIFYILIAIVLMLLNDEISDQKICNKGLLMYAWQFLKPNKLRIPKDMIINLK